jgi:hypothetical protein
MTFISEASIYAMSSIRGEGVRERFEACLHSYFGAWDCEYCGSVVAPGGVKVLFKRRDYALVLSVPLLAFQTPAYARVLIRRQLDLAECERRHAQETAMESV